MTHIIALAGPIGAGKSAIADQIARRFGAPRRSFGGVVRERAIARGMPTDRETLQTLGDEIIATEGWDQFCRSVVGPATETVVVDGVRHVGAVGGLARLAGRDHFAIVFVHASEHRRRARIAQRDGTSDADFNAAQGHPNEHEVSLVQQLATLVVTNESEDVVALHAGVEHIVEELRRRGFVVSS